MKKIKNILYTILLMLIVYFVYINLDDITKDLKALIISKNDLVIKEPNSYKVDYTFENFNYKVSYVPYNKEELIDIYFNVLNNGYNEFTFYCPKEYKNCTKDVESIGNDSKLMSNINNYVHPYNSFKTIKTKVSSNNEITLEIQKKYSEEKINKINELVNNVISELDLNNIDDLTKIERIHNYILNHTVYDKNTNNFDINSAYGSLIEGHAVCSGYADAFSIFMNIYKIPNIRVSSENHLWNLVYINGKWLHIDLTWDDSENNKYDNNYFLITKEKLFSLDTKEHNFDESFFIEAN
jgi:hypothetical protein